MYKIFSAVPWNPMLQVQFMPVAVEPEVCQHWAVHLRRRPGIGFQQSCDWRLGEGWGGGGGRMRLGGYSRWHLGPFLLSSRRHLCWRRHRITGRPCILYPCWHEYVAYASPFDTLVELTYAWDIWGKSPQRTSGSVESIHTTHEIWGYGEWEQFVWHMKFSL